MSEDYFADLGSDRESENMPSETAKLFKVAKLGDDWSDGKGLHRDLHGVQAHQGLSTYSEFRVLPKKLSLD